MSVRLSIIVPVYNVEPYLEHCLQSIVSQPLAPSDYEVLVINDGSPDGCAAIIDRLAKAYPQIIAIHQNNQGVSAARNAGLDRARGTVVTFVDSDDSLEPNSLPAVLERFEATDLDILYAHIQAIDENDNPVAHDYTVGFDDVVDTGFRHSRRTFPATFYRKSIIGMHRFPLGIPIGEDTVFNLKVQAFAQRVSYCSLPYYRYLLRGNSATKAVKTDKAYRGFRQALDEIIDFQKAYFLGHTAASRYFDAQLLLFLDRIAMHHVVYSLKASYFNDITRWVRAHQLESLWVQLSATYPAIHRPYIVFWLVQHSLRWKQRLRILLWRIKQGLLPRNKNEV
ncbi:glycosyltransferase family 2 protein [Flavobacterium sp.]|jgi:glycosyltransferase involved in cell wall biosynthesis|uniref:glycosyltransferase family 2 protein n=1 Tax=Flavobacterium sp. TaxID=239 RepID=UPI0022CB7E6A|nr:glycosyltransferase [Flavobacterium sp.]MCZ8169798.1 glycosyltransferase [Flavobacterium sp.]